MRALSSASHATYRDMRQAVRVPQPAETEPARGHGWRPSWRTVVGVVLTYTVAAVVGAALVCRVADARSGGTPAVEPIVITSGTAGPATTTSPTTAPASTSTPTT